MNEGGLTPQRWVERFQTDPVAISGRVANPPLPAGVTGEVIDFQEDRARLYSEGSLCEIRADKAASDGVACWLPGTHHEWAFQMPVKEKGKYRVLVVARVEGEGDGLAFTAGVYSPTAKGLVDRRYSLRDVSPEYRVYDLGTLDLPGDAYVWVAPPASDKVKSIWVDRVILEPR
jgi:hypothetical protein